MSFLGAAGMDKSSPSVLRQVGSRVDRDRSLQQDRLVSRPNIAGPSRERSTPRLQSASNTGFDLNGLAQQLSSVHVDPVWGRQRAAGPRAAQAGHADWAAGFAPTIQAAPVQQGRKEQSEWAQHFYPASIRPAQAVQPVPQQSIFPQHVSDPPWARPLYAAPSFNALYPPPALSFLSQPSPFSSIPPQPLQRPSSILREPSQSDHTAQIPAEPLSESQEVLARTAESFADQLDTDPSLLRDNPKLAQSQFVELLRGLGRREVEVDKSSSDIPLTEDVSAGPTFVERKTTGADWAANFLGGQDQTVRILPALVQPEEARLGMTNGAPALQASWDRQFQDQDAVLQSDRPTTSRRKSVHFDPSISHPASLLPERQETDLDIDADAFMAYNGAMRSAPPQRIGVGDMEGWGEVQKDWDEWLAQQSEDVESNGRTVNRFGDRYLFQADNPYVVQDAEGLRRESQSPTTQGVLELEAEVQRHPTNHQAWYNLGLAQQENEQEEQAILALSKSIELDPTHHPAYLALAVSQTNEGDHVTATAKLSQWLDRTQGAVDRTTSSTRSSGSAYQDRARLIERLIDQARQRPDDVDPDIQVALGVLFNANADYDKAEDCFLSALSARPTDWLLWNRLGATLANSGRSSEAIGHYERALALHPHFVRALFNLGIAHLNLGQYEVAAGKIVDALRLQQADMTQGYAVGERGRRKEGKGVGSEVLWNTLKGAYLHMGRSDLAALAGARSLDGLSSSP